MEASKITDQKRKKNALSNIKKFQYDPYKICTFVGKRNCSCNYHKLQSRLILKNAGCKNAKKKNLRSGPMQKADAEASKIKDRIEKILQLQLKKKLWYGPYK